MDGGQELTIKGWGLAKDVTVSVGGVNCEVIASSDEELTCITGAASEPSVDGVLQPGQPGLNLKVHDPADGSYPNYASMQAEEYPIVENYN